MKKLTLALGVLSLITFCSCSKDSSTNLEKETIVYAAGYEQQSTPTASTTLPTVWNKNISYNLPTNTNATFTTIRKTKIYNGITYSVGYSAFNDKEDIGALWIDDVLTSFGDGTTDTQINDIYINGTDIYIVGSERTTQHINVAKLWKNGEGINLTDGSKNASANGIFVKDNNVYVVGSEDNRSVFWKNSEPTYLTNKGNNYSSAVDIKLSGSDIYILGSERDPVVNRYIVKLWKNGIVTSITDNTYGASGNSLYLHNNDIYIAGRIFKNNLHFPVYWKNSQLIELERGNDYFASASDILIKNNDIYVTGTSNKVATLWINGERTELSTNNSAATCIYEK